MAPPNTSKSILDPNLADAMRALKLDIFRSLNCVKIGQIVSFNSAKKTAQVQILFKRQLPNGTSVSNPVLVDVPVFTMQGGGAALQLPIAAGDQCVVLFSDRNLDAWYQNGAEAVPMTSRAHDLSDGIALVGVNALTSLLAANPALEVRLSYQGALVGLKGGKVAIQNQTESLAMLMTTLLTTLAGLTDANNVPLSAASIAALTALIVQFNALLYTAI